MVEKSEVIEHQLEQTRSSLADKLSMLGDKISGTVETVEETVEDVTEAAVETVESVKDFFNLSKHVEERPWLVMGGAVLLGYMGGKLLTPSRQPTPQVTIHPQPTYTPMASAPGYESAATHHGNGSAQKEEPSMLSGLTDRLGPSISALKGLAIGSLFGLLRDMVTQALPDNLKSEIRTVLDDVTESVGGKPIQGSLIEESGSQSDQGSTTNEVPNRAQGDRNTTRENERSLQPTY